MSTYCCIVLWNQNIEFVHVIYYKHINITHPHITRPQITQPHITRPQITHPQVSFPLRAKLSIIYCWSTTKCVTCKKCLLWDKQKREEFYIHFHEVRPRNIKERKVAFFLFFSIYKYFLRNYKADVYVLITRLLYWSLGSKDCLFQDPTFGFSPLFCNNSRERWLGKEMYYQLTNSSYRDSLKILEADIEHANSLWVISFFLGVFSFWV